MNDDSKEFLAWIDAIAKGVIAGAAIGYLFSFTGMIPAAKAVVLGGLAGCLASVTFKNKRDELREQKKNEKKNDKK